MNLYRLFKRPLDRSTKLFEFDIFSHDCTLCFILFIQRYLHHFPINLPPTNVFDEFFEFFFLVVPRHIQPSGEDIPINTLHGLRNHNRHSNSHQLFETLHVGDQVCEKVVSVQTLPKSLVTRVDEVRVQKREFLHRLGQRPRRRSVVIIRRRRRVLFVRVVVGRNVFWWRITRQYMRREDG